MSYIEVKNLPTFRSSSPWKEATNECAWVPLTGMPKRFPAATFVIVHKLM